MPATLVRLRALRTISVTVIGVSLTWRKQLNHMTIDTSHGPPSPDGPSNVVRCGDRRSNSLSNSIVYATSAWDNSAASGSLSSTTAMLPIVQSTLVGSGVSRALSPSRRIS